MSGRGYGGQWFLPTYVRKGVEILGGPEPSSILSREKGQGFSAIEEGGGEETGIEMDANVTTQGDTPP